MAGRADAHRLVRPMDQPQCRRRLFGDLLQGAEEVRVVELDGAYAGEAAEDTGRLGAVHASQLGEAEREFAVAVGAGAVDERVVGTQARAQHHLLAAEFHRREHVLAVVRPVPGDLVQLALAQHR